MDGSQIRIRPCLRTDFESIHRLIQELENKEMNREILQGIFNEYWAKRWVFLSVAESEDLNVIGFISCLGQNLMHHEGLVFEIEELIVSQDFQGKGIGHLLVRAVQQEVEKLGAKSFEVTTHKRRTGAHRFYKSVGFINSHEKFTQYF